MSYFAIKTIISALIIALISEIARKSPGFAALVASLPLVSILGMIWIWRDTSDAAKIASHSEATFWYVLPSMPMFLVLPWMLRSGIAFWLALVGACLMTVLLYALTVLVAARFGVKL
mgnify:CR=1 FL=1